MDRVKVEVLDSLRAFAALSVCFFHFVCTVTGFIQNKFILDLFSFGQYGVQLFFVISGFVIPWAMFHAGYKAKDFFSFLLKRLTRLEPPYLFSIVLVLFVLFFREKLLGRSNDYINLSWEQVALHIGYLIPWFNGYQWLNQVYWTLAIEFQYYILVALSFVPLLKLNIIWRQCLYIIFVLLSLLGSCEFLPYWLPFFLLGILLFLFKIHHITKQEYFIVTGLLIIYCFTKYNYGAVLYGCVPLFAVVYLQDLKIKGLNSFGKFSYSIYLIHPVIGASLINVLSHYVQSAYAKALLIFLGISVTLIGAWVMFLLIEKPSKKLSSSINYLSISTKTSTEIE